MSILSFVLVGLLAGWLAATVTKGYGLGIFADIGVGITGSFIGAYLFSALGLLAYGFVGHVVMAFLGALVLLLVVGLFKRSSV